MVDIGMTQPVLVSLPSIQVGQPGPVLAPIPSEVSPSQTSYNAQDAEQKRLDTVQALSQQVASYPLGEQKLGSIFKDLTGQYVARIINLIDGKVTYYPEPVLYKQALGANLDPLVKINA